VDKIYGINVTNVEPFGVSIVQAIGYQQFSLVIVELHINFSTVRSCSKKSHPNKQIASLTIQKSQGSIEFCNGLNEFHLIVVCIFV
jgi:hypothetical protein